MKRIFAFLLLAALLLSLSPASFADVVDSRSFSAREVNLNSVTNTIAIREEDSQYFKLINAQGDVLVPESAGYITMTPRSGTSFFKVEAASDDGIHDDGLIDSDGSVIVPAEYADINLISARWQAGVRLVPCEADDKDYTFSNFMTGEKVFLRIDSVDFFFDGQKVGTLSRSEYGGGSCQAYGAYVCVTNTARERIFYNAGMEKSSRPAEYSGEFDSVYKDGKTSYFHQGSGQQAFVPECTLDPGDLENPYLYDRGKLYDLQGNLVFTPPQNYESVRAFKNGYSIVRMNGYTGVLSIDGTEVIEPIYDSIGYSEDMPFAYGYISAVKDGKFGFLDLNGNVTCPFVYSEDIVRNKITFATVKDLDGTTIVLSAAVGELPERYEDVSFPGGYDNGCLAFVAEKAGGQLGVVDIYGETQIPFSDEYRSIELSKDGTVAVISLGSRQYMLCLLDITAPAPGAPAPAAPSGDGSWTCANGHSGNTGNFCSECGAPRPSADKCASCGYEFGDSTPKFCPNCGQPVSP